MCKVIRTYAINEIQNVKESLNKMYLSYIRPILEYADVLWDGCSNENESRIEKVQLEAARLVSGLTRSTSTNRIYQEIGWKTLHRRRKEKKLILFHKIVHNIAPSYLRDLLPLTVGQNTHYHLRNQMNFIEPRCRLDFYRKSFFPSTINMWNSLPQSLREITNLNSFKRSITERTISVPRFYFNGERKYAILHARLRNKCSNLNHDLFTNHISLTEKCACNANHETTFHYFFECVNYTNERMTMLRSLHQFSFQTDLNTILFGDSMLTDEQNDIIFSIIQTFIKQTKRFS